MKGGYPILTFIFLIIIIIAIVAFFFPPVQEWFFQFVEDLFIFISGFF